MVIPVDVEFELTAEVAGVGAKNLDPDALGPPWACLAAAVFANPIPCLLLPAWVDAFRRGGRLGGGADRLAYAFSAEAATSPGGI